MKISVSETRLGIYSINKKALEISENQVVIMGTKEEATELKKVLGSKVTVEVSKNVQNLIRLTSQSDFKFDELDNSIVVYVLVEKEIELCF